MVSVEVVLVVKPVVAVVVMVVVIECEWLSWPL